MMECNTGLDCSECQGCESQLDYPDTNFVLEQEMSQRLDEIDQLELESRLLNERSY